MLLYILLLLLLYYISNYISYPVIRIHTIEYSICVIFVIPRVSKTCQHILFESKSDLLDNRQHRAPTAMDINVANGAHGTPEEVKTSVWRPDASREDITGVCQNIHVYVFCTGYKTLIM